MKQSVKRDHSPACKSRRGGSCDCELSLGNKTIWVSCICGNSWQEAGRRDYRVDECFCPSPADEEDDTPDDSINNRSKNHTYNVDRL